MSNDGQIEVDAGTGGIFVDTSVVTTGDGSGQNRQRVAIGDAVQGEQFLGVGADGAASVHVLTAPSGSASVSANITNPYIPVTQQGNWGASINNVVPVSQSGPWAASVDGTVVATQGGPWTVAATQQGNYGASISNFPTNQAVTQGTVPWAASVEGQVGVTQITSPWVTSGTSTVSGSVSAIQTGTWSTVVSGSVTAIPTGVQSVSQSTTPWAASVQGQVTVSGSVQALPSSADIGYVGTWATAGPVSGQTSSSVKAVPLTTNSYPSTNGILVQGLSTNIASVFVGASTVASVGVTGGFEIQAGQSVPQTAANASQVFIIGPNNTDSVCWTVL